ncbi:lactonase family protein [Salinicola aestuarinus]|uniref:lactonase family protein n=1 Tax=Salinicola aestuarinus TaxID=1949082 RepID=UPI000DA25E76|nr:lactonase family protein [Salinicola aestuarinus]
MPRMRNQAVSWLTGGALLAACLSAQAATYVYVSNADDGVIASYTLDRDSATLTPLTTTKAEDSVMPMALSPDLHHLYAGIGSEPYRVLSYRIDPESGELTREGSGSLPSPMAYIDTDESGNYLLSASYSDDIASVGPIDADGVAGDSTQTVDTGQRAHAIQTTPDNRFAFVSVLGDDQITQFRFDADSGELSANEPATVDTPEGTGPRHFRFAPDSRHLYVLGELTGAVTTYAIDADDGTLTRQGTVEGVPEALDLAHGIPQEDIPDGDETLRIWAADIQVTPDGRYVYISERTSSLISTLKADPETGELSYQRSLPVELQPRGFRIDDTGRYMVVSGQLDGELGLYRIDPENGGLEKVDSAATGDNANWVEIVSYE